ncbi:MAG: DUF4350 domain-containing protein [Verrucomicrobiota bacterium]
MTQIALFAALLTLGGCGGSGPGPNTREVEIGFVGPARSNPFLAAERFVNEMGSESVQQFDLTDMPSTDVALIVPAEALRADPIARRLIEWVEIGGHLVYLLEGGDTFQNDWANNWVERREEERRRAREEKSDSTGESNEPNETELVPIKDDILSKEQKDHPLLTRLDIEVTDRDVGTDTVTLSSDELAVLIPDGKGFDAPDWRDGPQTAIRSGERDAASFLTFFHEAGRVTLIADAHPWRNRYIGDDDHARFLWEVLTLDGVPTQVWLLRGTRMSFMKLLWRYGWMPMLSLAVFIVFWIWFSVPRFGPATPPPAAASREFTSHLAMAGAFLWKSKAVEALLDPIRRRIFKRYRARTQMDSGEILALATDELSESTGIAKNRVRAALKHAQVKDPGQLTAILRDLQKLDNAYERP